MPIRPPSSVVIAILNPPPTSPRSASSGSRTSSRNTCDDLLPRIPSLSSGGPQRTPLAFIGRMNAVMPLWPAALSFIVNSTQTSATGPLVIQFLVPLITQPSPSRTAVVRCAGWRCSRSISAALGRTSLVANSCAVRWTASWSSVGASCMSLPLELGRAPRLGEERRHSLALIRGREQEAERLLLECQGVLERRRLAELDQALDLGDRERAVGRDPAGHVPGLRDQLAGRPHRVGKADPQRLGRVDHVAGHAQLLGLGDPDPSGEPLRPAEPRDDAELDLGLAELRVLGRVDEVARQRQ